MTRQTRSSTPTSHDFISYRSESALLIAARNKEIDFLFSLWLCELLKIEKCQMLPLKNDKKWQGKNWMKVWNKFNRTCTCTCSLRISPACDIYRTCRRWINYITGALLPSVAMRGTSERIEVASAASTATPICDTPPRRRWARVNKRDSLAHAAQCNAT